MNGEIILCGGGAIDSSNNANSCLKLDQDGEIPLWKSYATTKNERNSHSSWVSPKGLMLLGSYYNSGERTAELIEDGQSTLTFDTENAIK